MWNLRDPGLIVVIFDLKLDGPNLNNLEFEGLCRSEAFRMAPMSNMRVFCQNVSQSVDPTADGRLGVGGGRREEGPQLFKDYQTWFPPVHCGSQRSPILVQQCNHLVSGWLPVVLTERSSQSVTQGWAGQGLAGKLIC